MAASKALRALPMMPFIPACAAACIRPLCSELADQGPLLWESELTRVFPWQGVFRPGTAKQR